MFSSVAALEEKKSSSCIPRVFAQKGVEDARREV
jgi:hypothetical protein